MPDFLDDTLAHYGVRGMRWGVRKRSGSSSNSGEPEDVKIVTRPGHRIEVSGGRNQPPHEDAKRAHALKQKGQASSVHALSNAEVKAVVERMRLESDWAKIMASAEAQKKGKGRKFLENLVKEEGGALLQGKKGPKTQLVETMITVGRGVGYVGARRAPDYVGKRRG